MEKKGFWFALKSNVYVEFKEKRILLYDTKCGFIFIAMLVWFSSCTFLPRNNNVPVEMSMWEYTNSDVENLSLLCKIWGFMKYYHPAVRAGEYDWDHELLCIMPSLVSLPSKDKRNEILVKWIDQFDFNKKNGNYNLCASDSIKLLPDLDWIEDEENLGTTLSDQLKEIRDAKRDTISYYVNLGNENMGEAVFEHEERYSKCTFPNISYQLLSLFRLWNAIQYYFPYKYLLNNSWDDVLLDNIPVFLEITDRTDYENALKRFIAEVHDTHAGIYGGPIKKYLVPVVIRFIEGKAVVTEYYELKSSFKGEEDRTLQPGDVIVRVNSEEVDSIVKRITPYISASNEATLQRQIAVNELLWSNDTLLYVDYERNGAIEKTRIRCVPNQMCESTVFQKPQPLISYLSPDILYLYMGSTIGGEVPREIKSKGMIIDLRAYPVMEKINGYWEYNLLYPSSTDFATFTHGSLLQPGLFTFGPVVKVGKENEDYYQGKKVILINETTQSHAEFMAMKYRCPPNAVVMGSTTAGADGNCSFLILPGNFRATFTGLGVYYPDKSETQQIGILPDIEVKSTIQGIHEGCDEVLEAAIKYLNTEEVR